MDGNNDALGTKNDPISAGIECLRIAGECGPNGGGDFESARCLACPFSFYHFVRQLGLEFGGAWYHSRILEEIARKSEIGEIPNVDHPPCDLQREGFHPYNRLRRSIK